MLKYVAYLVHAVSTQQTVVPQYSTDTEILLLLSVVSLLMNVQTSDKCGVTYQVHAAEAQRQPAVR